MRDPFGAARSRVEQVRFSDDAAIASGSAPATTAGIRRRLAQDGLLISREVTPRLHDVISRTEDALRLPRQTLTAFVEAAPHIQATCHRESPENCVVVLTSTLVELLDPNELAFVVGHELGHFLLGHGITEMAARDNQIEVFMQMRAQEISADRVGLLACRDLGVAVQALMKTLSGLSARHVQFDVRAFLAQLRALGAGPSARHAMSTHPSILVRCRALMWFAPAAVLDDEIVAGQRLVEVDERIRQDLRHYADGPALERIRQLEDDLALWLAAARIAADGVFDRAEQEHFAAEFGEETLKSLRGFLSMHTATAARSAIAERVRDARERLLGASPRGFDSAMRRINTKLGQRFGPGPLPP